MNKNAAARIVDRFLSRIGMEFDSPEALKKYLHEHPDADKSKHSVKKPEKGDSEGDSGGDPEEALDKASDELEAAAKSKDEKQKEQARKKMAPVVKRFTKQRDEARQDLERAIKDVAEEELEDPDAQEMLSKAEALVKKLQRPMEDPLDPSHRVQMWNVSDNQKAVKELVKDLEIYKR